MGHVLCPQFLKAVSIEVPSTWVISNIIENVWVHCAFKFSDITHNTLILVVVPGVKSNQFEETLGTSKYPFFFPSPNQDLAFYHFLNICS